ncbi:MAG: DUF1800 domain-containing protein [Opitutaceae bacterium]|nr:DUF1800 domain-containing protein [Opitutaceae bacterium]
MSLSRRQFIAAGAGAVALAGAGCGRPKDWVTETRRLIGKPTAPPLAAVLTPSASSEIDAVSHAINRLTFGARPGDYRRVATMGVEAFIEEQLAPARITDTLCARVIRHEFDSLADPEGSFFRREEDAADPLQKLFPALRGHGARVGDLYEFKDKVLLEDLTRATVLRAVLSERQLFEVMVHFWSDHFNIDPSKAEAKWLKAADDRDVIRSHALGNFRDMVRASAVSPAMLWYLDGRANRVSKAGDKPNENYARELLELHTLGVHGGYTQQDVMEVARCLTGWTVRDRKKFFKGRVEFNARQHDDGTKRVLGIEIPAGLGAADLDRVLEIVASHPQTARHIAAKLCRRFIADEAPEAAIRATAAAFMESQGDIPATLRALFATAEFRAPATRGAKFKRPFHFVVSALRATNAETDATKQLIDYLLRLGHAPFRYATPEGYPEVASHWQNTLLWRWNFSTALAANRIKGTRVAISELRMRVGGDEALMATVLGRRATADEQMAYRECGADVALLLAAPAFQRS